MKQIIIRVDDDFHRLFKAAAEEHHGSMQNAVVRFMEGYVKHAHEGAIFHLNGEMCPVYAMINALTATVRLELESKAVKTKSPTLV
jgi:hypothetical protein